MENITPADGIQGGGDALTWLYRAGAHFVLAELVDDGRKRPIWTAWQRFAPSLELVQAHRESGARRILGIIPHSVQTTGLDVDYGNPAILIAAHPPLVAVPTRRPGGQHLYYPDDVPRRNAQWAAYGASGEVRGAYGFLTLWDDAPERLADALQNPGRATRFPYDLFGWAAVERPAADPARRKPADKGSVKLESVYPGARNIALFDDVRYVAYKAAMPLLVSDWHQKIADIALAENERFPQALPESEVLLTAYSISSWTWDRRQGDGWQYAAADPVAQARRGRKSGKARRVANIDRNAAILSLADEGIGQEEIAWRMGISRQTVWRVLKSGRQGLAMARAESLTGQQPGLELM